MRNAFVEKIETFLALPESDRRWLETFCSSPRTVGSGFELVREGEKLPDVHVLLSGFAVRSKLMHDGEEQFLGYLIPGDFCDLHVALLERMDHGIRTLSPSVVVDLPRDAILEAVSRRPELAKAFWWCSLLNEAILREWISNLGQKSASERLAHLFCEMHARLASIGLAHRDGSFAFPVTQLELGKTVGLSVVHVQRSLKALKEAGLLSFRSARVRINDMEQLQSFAGFDSRYLHLRPRPV